MLTERSYSALRKEEGSPTIHVKIQWRLVSPTNTIAKSSLDNLIEYIKHMALSEVKAISLFGFEAGTKTSLMIESTSFILSVDSEHRLNLVFCAFIARNISEEEWTILEGLFEFFRFAYSGEKEV